MAESRERWSRAGSGYTSSPSRPAERRRGVLDQPRIRHRIGDDERLAGRRHAPAEGFPDSESLLEDSLSGPRRGPHEHEVIAVHEPEHHLAFEDHGGRFSNGAEHGLESQARRQALGHFEEEPQPLFPISRPGLVAHPHECQGRSHDGQHDPADAQRPDPRRQRCPTPDRECRQSPPTIGQGDIQQYGVGLEDGWVAPEHCTLSGQPVFATEAVPKTRGVIEQPSLL